MLFAWTETCYLMLFPLPSPSSEAATMLLTLVCHQCQLHKFIGGNKRTKEPLSWIWMKTIFWQLYLWLFYIQPCAASERGDGLTILLYDVRTYVPSCLFVRTFVCLLSASNEPMLYLDCCLCWLGSLVVLQYLYFYMWNHLQNKDKKNLQQKVFTILGRSFLLSSFFCFSLVRKGLLKRKKSGGVPFGLKSNLLKLVHNQTCFFF